MFRDDAEGKTGAGDANVRDGGVGNKSILKKNGNGQGGGGVGRKVQFAGQNGSTKDNGTEADSGVVDSTSLKKKVELTAKKTRNERKVVHGPRKCSIWIIIIYKSIA